MKPIFIFNDTLTFIFTGFNKNFGGITLYPFILLKKKHRYNDKIILHEKIHYTQQSEGLIKFYYNYLKEYFKLKKQYKNKQIAYRNISYENEAYCNQYDDKYLKDRPKGNHLRYRDYVVFNI